YISMLNTILALSLCADFGKGLTEFPLFQVDFDLGLPDLEQLLKGIWQVVEELSLEEVFSEFVDQWYGEFFDKNWLLDWQKTLEWLFKNLLGTLWNQFLGGYCQYGIGTYGMCIYAPVQPEYPPPEQQTIDYSAHLPPLTTGFSQNPALAEAIRAMLKDERMANALINRIDLCEALLEQGFFFGFNLLGYTKFPKKVVKDGVTYVEIEWRGQKLYIPSLDTVVFGFIIGVTPLGAGRFSRPAYTVFAHRAFHFAYHRARRQVSRFMSPFSSTLFRSTTTEMTDFSKSRKLTKYGAHRGLAIYIRQKIKRMLRPLGLDPMTVNMYCNAALDLAFSTRVGHRRKDEWKAKIDDATFKEAWFRKWSAMGLNRTILTTIYDEVVTWRKAWRTPPLKLPEKLLRR
ncbi:MAG: hypothetical protein DRP01_06785, partial [Archaeoglobales archaeon]